MASLKRAIVLKSLNSLKKSSSFISSSKFSTTANEVKDDELKTHTGQKWDEKDYRLVRFMDKPKQINERFAINLIAEVPPQPVKARVTYCDGGGGPLGHPKVYINLDQPGNHICGYCGLRFVQESGHH